MVTSYTGVIQEGDFGSAVAYEDERKLGVMEGRENRSRPRYKKD